ALLAGALAGLADRRRQGVQRLRSRRAARRDCQGADEAGESLSFTTCLSLSAYARGDVWVRKAVSRRGVVDSQFAELAVQRRAPDPQPPRDLGHAAAIMADGEADDVGLDLIQRAQIAVGVEQCDAARGRHRCGAGDAVARRAERGDLW